MCVAVVVLVLRSVCHEFLSDLVLYSFHQFHDCFVQVPLFPKYTPPVVQRNLKSCVQVSQSMSSLMQIVGNDKECVSVWSLLCVLCLWLLKCISRTETQLRRIALNHQPWWQRPGTTKGFAYVPHVLRVLRQLFVLVHFNFISVFIVQDYVDLATSYITRNIADVKGYITTHEDVFKSVSFLTTCSIFYCLF